MGKAGERQVKNCKYVYQNTAGGSGFNNHCHHLGKGDLKMEFDMTKPVPVTQPWSEKFWEGTKQGKLLIQVCNDCKSKIFYPRKFCPECWSGNLGWIEASGKAKIYTFSTAYGMVEPKFMDELPYTIAYVDLDEGITHDDPDRGVQTGGYQIRHGGGGRLP